MKLSLISSVNDEAVLKSSLLASCLDEFSEIILQRGFASAPRAYNEAIEKATSDILVFVHQDMYLPRGWVSDLRSALSLLESADPGWGVLGVWGAVDSRDRVGYLWWTGNQGMENPFSGVKEVVSLDEVVLIFRKSSGLRFDDLLPGFHMYGTDICLEARRRGMKSYAISAFCIHNTNIGGLLPRQFWECYFFMRKKWAQFLPVDTPCTRITFSCWPILRWHLVYLRNVLLGRQKKLGRIPNPQHLYEKFRSEGVIQSPPEKISIRPHCSPTVPP